MESELRQVGHALYTAAREASPEVAREHRWEFSVLNWCMRNDDLRTRVLRFIDCLPALRGDRTLVRHLREYFPYEDGRLPLPLRMGVRAAIPGLVTGRAAAAATRSVADRMSRLFLAGADLTEAAPVLRELQARGFRIAVDLLGEETVSEPQADRVGVGYRALIERWADAGLAGPPNLSVKLSALAFPFDPADPDGTWDRLAPRLIPILEAAWSRNGSVTIDMEQFEFRDLTLGIARRLLSEHFPKEHRLGVVIQSYLKDAEAVTRDWIGWARARGRPVGLRLVRGAYWDTEVILSRQRNWPCPVYPEKRLTDAAYERLLDLLFENASHLRIAVATHNLRSLARAVVLARRHSVPPDAWEAQMLYGMSLPLQRALLRQKIPLRLYVPVGALLPGMGYLVRRILENSSQSAFLAMGISPPGAEETLLEAPAVTQR